MDSEPTNDKRRWYREEYLNSEHWQALKREKLRRTDHCAVCKTKQHLDVHHLQYKSIFDVTLRDLRVLCRRCHVLAHESLESGVRPRNGDISDSDAHWVLLLALVRTRLIEAGEIKLSDKAQRKAEKHSKRAEKAAFYKNLQRRKNSQKRRRCAAWQEFSEKPWSKIYGQHGLGPSVLS